MAFPPGPAPSSLCVQAGWDGFHFSLSKGSVSDARGDHLEFLGGSSTSRGRLTHQPRDVLSFSCCCSGGLCDPFSVTRMSAIWKGRLGPSYASLARMHSLGFLLHRESSGTQKGVRVSHKAGATSCTQPPHLPHRICLRVTRHFLLLVQEMHRRLETAPDSAKTKALQTVIEMKVSEIEVCEPVPWAPGALGAVPLALPANTHSQRSFLITWWLYWPLLLC